MFIRFVSPLQSSNSLCRLPKVALASLRLPWAIFFRAFGPLSLSFADIGSAVSFKHPHLRRRANCRVLQADGNEAHTVTETCGNAVRPFLKFRARPLEAMVAMPKLAGGQCLPFHVVFAVGRCNDDGLWLGALEQHALECDQARCVEVFNHFYDGDSIETGEALVPVDERTVKETHAFLLNGRQAVVMQAVAGDFKRAMRHVHAYDFGKLLFFEE